ncbi:MAG: AraC family transcriptional regulator [Flavobacteriales bacterium]|nr:AraC family transcriptional regulator [Flavobacteriales bacterium]
MVKLLNTLFSGSLILLSFIIFLNPKNYNIKANKWFSGFIFCVFLISFQTLLLDLSLESDNSFIEIIVSIAVFSVAPVLYLSVRYFIEPETKWTTTDYFHFLFASLFTALSMIALFEDDNNKVENISSEIVALTELIFNLIFSIQVILYCLLSLRKILRHQKNVWLFSSSTENIDLKWLEFICIGILIMSIFWVIDIIFDLSTKSSIFDYFTSSLYLTSVFFITYNWLKQKEIYPYNNDIKKEINKIIIETDTPESNKKKLISDERLDEIKIDLLNLMETKKPFLDCELNLVKLASELKLSSHLLSYSLNKGFNENFYQFVNRYRVEEAKKILIDSSKNNLNLVGIAFEVGFNSKTAFNTTFKKITNQTPSDYKKLNS